MQVALDKWRQKVTLTSQWRGTMSNKRHLPRTIAVHFYILPCLSTQCPWITALSIYSSAQCRRVWGKLSPHHRPLSWGQELDSGSNRQWLAVERGGKPKNVETLSHTILGLGERKKYVSSHSGFVKRPYAPVRHVSRITVQRQTFSCSAFLAGKRFPVHQVMAVSVSRFSR